MKKVLIGLLLTAGFIFLLVTKDNLNPSISKNSDFSIKIEKGNNYLHNYNIFWFINKKNPPQIAIWSEDKNGNYIDTLYVTDKVKEDSWKKSPGDKESISRPEALPVWSHKVVNKADIVSSASKENIDINLDNSEKIYKIFVEVNHSTDFNKYFPKDANINDKNYSGGEFGSGQPSLIYVVNIHDKENDFKLVGTGHPAGKDGEIHNLLDKVDTAKRIIKPMIEYK